VCDEKNEIPLLDMKETGPISARDDFFALAESCTKNERLRSVGGTDGFPALGLDGWRALVLPGTNIC
jgi:hypothetical protein